jgi:hypothetical protein
MSYIDIRKQKLQEQLTKVQTVISSLYDLLAEQSGTGVISYSFNSGEGEQHTVRRSLSDILDQLERLQATEDWLIREQYNMGLVSVAVRRKLPS